MALEIHRIWLWSIGDALIGILINIPPRWPWRWWAILTIILRRVCLIEPSIVANTWRTCLSARIRATWIWAIGLSVAWLPAIKTKIVCFLGTRRDPCKSTRNLIGSSSWSYSKSLTSFSRKVSMDPTIISPSWRKIISRTTGSAL